MTYAILDSATMLRRQFRHWLRNPSVTLQLAAFPILFLLLFVIVFGGTLGDGLGGGSGGRQAYLNYVTPGVIMMSIAAGTTGTAISVAMDMTEGIVARFRTMAIARVAVLTGHVVASVIQTLLVMGLVLVVSLLLGFRPNATPIEWLATAGLLAMLAFAFTWLAVAFGVVAKTVESASSMPQPFVFLPFLGSGFVPTDSMPAWLRWFAEHQPFTPFIETLRGLLMGTPIGNGAVVSVAWAAGIALGGYIWAKKRYNRDPSR
jgi:ABC-2 type transport system permease protein